MVTSGRSLFLIVVATASFALSIHLGRSAADLREHVMTEDDRYYLPPSNWLRAFCLGYTEAAADLVWIKTIVFFGREMKGSAAEATGFTANYLLTAVDLDPRFRPLYVYGSTLTMFQNHGKVSKETVRMAIDLLERGAAVFPDDGEILFQLGFMHYYEMRRFFLEDKDNPEWRKHEDEGLRLIARSSLMKGAPPYAARLSATLMGRAEGKSGMEDLVVEHLKMLLAKETDPKLRELLENKLRAAIGEAAERDILETARLQTEWMARMPYVPYDFYLILRPDFSVAELRDPLYRWNRLLDL